MNLNGKNPSAMPPSRREFLQQSMATSLAIAAGMIGHHVLAAAPSKAGRWLVACRDGHLKVTGKNDCWAALKELDVKGVEVDVTSELLCPGLYHPDKKYSVAKPEDIKVLQQDLEANGVTITAFCMRNRLDEQLERELETARRLVQVAQQFHVNAIRLDVVPRALKREQFLPFAIKACSQLCKIVEGTPVRLGIENHGNTTNDPEFLQKLFDGAGSAQLGLTLDPCNFYWYGHPLNDLYGIFEKFASRVFHTHCKSINYPEEKRNVRRAIGWEYGKYTAPLYQGDIDYQRVAAILRRANYQGDLCLENECLHRFPKEEGPGILRKEISFLRQLSAE